VQNYSLAPTRSAVINIILNHFCSDDFTLLDLGCGTGQLLSELREHKPNCHLLGVDKSHNMVRYARNCEKDFEVVCADADNDDLGCITSESSVDAVVCCHSFPYYKNKIAVLTKLHNILTTGGIAIFVQASINTLYDKLVLRVVEATAEKADYLSCKEFRALIEDHFDLMEEFSIRERFFMPSICGFVMRKR